MLAWIMLLAMAYHTGLPDGVSDRRTQVVGVLVGATAALLLALHGAGIAGLPERLVFVSRAYAWLTLNILGLVLVEALLHQARTESLWRVKFLCVGVGGILVYEVFLCSEALVLQRWDPLFVEARGAISLLAAPLVAVAAARNPDWSVQLNLSRRAVYHSSVLVGVALFLLVTALAGSLLGRVQADWGRILQIGFLFMALALLALIYLSATVRSFAKFQFGRYLFTYRHDYREQWQRFSRALASGGIDMNLRERALAAVSSMFDSPVAGLWLREEDVFHIEVDQRLPSTCADVDGNAELIAELEAHPTRVLELACREQDRPEWIPDWLRSWRSAWVVVPLSHRTELIGFIVLIRTWPTRVLHPEDEELLQVVAGQTASYLSEERSIRALEESNRFQEISRGMVFIAHDLRNMANAVDLMLANARKHMHEPAFQRDLLFSIQEFVARMKRLLDKLGDVRQRTDSDMGADLARLVRESAPTCQPERFSLRLEVEPGATLPVAVDSDRLVAITRHLIQNALEAAGPQGHVAVHVGREGDAALFAVKDDGPGMTRQFLRERLRHPFGSSKPDGYGVGLFECRRFAREVGGHFEIDSTPGQGTLARLRLPLVEAREVRGATHG
jgi:putative PEP-CTERM system histidine kinase